MRISAETYPSRYVELADNYIATTTRIRSPKFNRNANADKVDYYLKLVFESIDRVDEVEDLRNDFFNFMLSNDNTIYNG